MGDWLMRIVQLAIIIAVTCAAIYLDLADSGVVVGATAVFAAIAFTYAWYKGVDTVRAVRTGAPLPFPPKRTIFDVAWKTVAVVIGIAIAGTVLGLTAQFLFENYGVRLFPGRS